MFEGLRLRLGLWLVINNKFHSSICLQVVFAMAGLCNGSALRWQDRTAPHTIKKLLVCVISVLSVFQHDSFRIRIKTSFFILCSNLINPGSGSWGVDFIYSHARHGDKVHFNYHRTVVLGSTNNFAALYIYTHTPFFKVNLG